MIAAPERDCPLCPRLVAYRRENQAKFPSFFNGPVPSFGDVSSPLLVVGMAPGVKGANRTGRPFTGDYAGVLLYETLAKFGFSRGVYGARADDGLGLVGCRIVNAARCVPPQNKLTPAEINTCNGFLAAEIAGMPALRVVLALGGDAHGGVLKAVGLRKSAFTFSHGAAHVLPSGVVLVDSYHVSRLNTSTKRLTTAMFEDVVRQIRDRLSL